MMIKAETAEMFQRSGGGHKRAKGYSQPLEPKKHKKTSEPPEGTNPAKTLTLACETDFGILTSQTVRE